MLAFAAVRSIRRARELWLSIEWVITDHDLTRRSPHVPMVVIRRNEVVRIDLLRNAGLVVRGTGREQFIYVPPSIERREDLAERLSGWREPVPAGRPASYWVSLGLSLTWVAAFLIFFASTRPAVVAPLGVLVAAGLVWTVWATRRSKHVDERTRRLSLWLLLLLVVIALRITLVLSNGRMWAWMGAGQ
jgi:Flp pilus assembly protein TadB